MSASPIMKRASRFCRSCRANARFIIGDADIDNQSAGEAREQSIRDVGDFIRRPIARHHDLRTAPLQHVEESQQFTLHFRTSGEELHVIKEKHAGRFVPLLKGVETAALERLVELLHVVVECHVFDAKRRLLVLGGVADSMHQMRLAKARRTVHKQRVVQDAWRVGNRFGSGYSEAVGRAGNEGIEAEALIEFHVSAVSSQRRLAYPFGH